MMPQEQVNAHLAAWVILAIVAAVVYVVPSIVAFSRRHPNRWPILILNLLFGGTGLGWLGTLVWAARAVHKSPTGSNGGESGLNIFANDPLTVRVASDGSQPMPSVIEQIERLAALRASGAIDEAEFTSMKASLLAKAN